MSSLAITFKNIVGNGKIITVIVNNGSEDIPLVLECAPIRQFGTFKKPNDELNTVDYINEAAKNYEIAFNLDFNDIGGSNNLLAQVQSPFDGKRKVEIQLNNPEWQFVDVTENDWQAEAIDFEIKNNPPTPPVSVSIDSVTKVDCDNVQLEIGITGGVQPYTVNVNSQEETQNPTIQRPIVANIEVFDTEGATKSLLFEMRKLQVSDFNIDLYNAKNGSTITIEDVNVPANLKPVQYSIDGVSWKAENSFTGLGPDIYNIQVRDKFECPIVLGPVKVDSFTTTIKPYIFIPKANPLRFHEAVNGVKRNHLNERSIEEDNQINYPHYHCYLQDDTVSLQFHTNYDYIKATLRSGNSVLNIPIKKETDNIGKSEKIDCMKFDAGNGFTGIYFDGGNNYIPGTSTQDGNSKYRKDVSPIWASKIGIYVTIEGIGTKKIVSRGFDNQRGAWYFTVKHSYTDLDTQSKVEVNYNVQNYEVYTCKIPCLPIVGKGFVVLEFGHEANNVQKYYASEFIKIIEDDDTYKILEWDSLYNVAGLVFAGLEPQKMFARVQCKKGIAPDSSSKTHRADGGSFNVDQDTFITQTLEFEKITTYQAVQLSAWSGFPFFKVNGILLKKSDFESTKQGESNYHDVKITFDLGGNILSEGTDDLIIDESQVGDINVELLSDGLGSLISIG